MKVRSGFVGSFVAMVGAVVPWALVTRDLVPLAIWCLTFSLLVVFSRPTSGN